MIADSHPETVARIEKLVSAEISGCIYLRANDLTTAATLLGSSQPHLLMVDAHFEPAALEHFMSSLPKEGRKFSLVMLTANKSEENFKALFDLGADDILIKPLDELIFQSKIRSLLSGHYISALSFLGRREGLADLALSLVVQSIKINEAEMILISDFMLAKGLAVGVDFAGLALHGVVHNCQRSELFPKQYELHLSLDSLNEEHAAQFRRLLVDFKAKSQQGRPATKGAS